ncbi:MAG: Hpt domain-containing protein [Steroidobacteraceae bacterium]|nr:Hpt domain-containing protein [Steroidobacteraceae bacterium]
MQGAKAVWVAVAILALAFLVGVLAPAWYFAGRLVENNTAVRAIGELQQQPSRMQAALNSIQDRLRARGFVRDSIEQLKRATTQFESATATLKAGGGVSIGGIGGDDDVTNTITEMTAAWKKYEPALTPVANFTAIPYSDSEREGTQLNVDGRDLQQRVTNAVTQSRVYTPQLEKNLAQIIAGLQASSDSLATALRSVVLIGVGLAAALAALVGYLSLARGKQAAAATAARQQTEDILSTVREGLFLLDADLRIGTIHSHATAQLFQRETVSGLTFEDLLRDLVTAKTLAIATKFIKVLWSERTKENLIRSINPLNEVEIVVGEKGSKDAENRYLEFNFHRVRRDGAITHVLVAVSDVTARVALAAQLKGAQDSAQSQMDAFLSILHVDPNQLSSFLDDSDVAFKMINATLRDPARDSASFRRKIDGLFRQIHSIKGEASAIGLGSMEARAHALESDLAALRERTDLSGNDFLPLLTKFDDLVSHSQSVRDMVTKLASFRDSFGKNPPSAIAGSSTAHVSTGDTTSRTPKLSEDQVAANQAAEQTLQRSAREGFVASAQQLADRIAGDHGKKVVVTCRGHDLVPEAYRRPVKDVLIQLIRNSVVHGIESPQERQDQGKSPEGHIRISFEMTESGRAFRMQCEDDGRGLTPDKLRDTAVSKGIISQNDAAALSDQEAMMLVFRSGFSTANGVTRDAGRGVGMDVIAEIAARLQGRISLNSEIGKNMKLSLSFPAAQSPAGVVAA